MSSPTVAPRHVSPAGAAVVWSAFAGLALGQLLVDVDDVVLNIALPRIVADVGFTASAVPWAVNAYLLCFGGLLLLGGRAADRWGHRRVLLSGVAVFVGASLAGAAATSPALVVAARAGQGVAAALLAPAAMSLLVHTFPDPARRTRALGLWGAVTGLGAVAGLVVGGMVTEHLGWRWIFTGNAGVAVVVGISVAALLPGGTGDRTLRVDVRSAVLTVAGLVALVGGLQGSVEHGWASPEVLAQLGAAVVLLPSAVRAGLRSSAPLVPRRLLRDRALVVADACAALVGAALLGTFYFVSLHLQQVGGYTPLRAALAYLPLVGGLVVAAGAGSALLPSRGARPLLASGMALCAGGLVLLSSLGLTSGAPRFGTGLLPGLAVTGLGIGLAFVSLTAAAVPGGDEAAGTPDGGVASGLYNTALQLGGALGIAVLSTVATWRSDQMLTLGAQPAASLTSGRDLALLVAAVALAAGVPLAMRMPASTARTAASDGVPGGSGPAAPAAY